MSTNTKPATLKSDVVELPGVAAINAAGQTTVINAAVKCRLSFLVTRLEQAGAEKQLSYVARGLAQRGWSVQVISLMTPIALHEELEMAGVEVVSLNVSPERRLRELPVALTGLARVLRHHKPQVLCTFNYHADILGRLVGRFAKVPIITSSLRNESFGGAKRDCFIRLTNFLTPVITVNSEQAAKALVRRKVIPQNKLRVMPNAIEIAEPSQDRLSIRRSLGIAEQDFLWLAVGRLEEQKDFANLLRAFQQLPESQHLAIAGEGKLKDDLQALSKSLTLEQRVQFLGRRDDVTNLMHAADAFVLSSRHEGLPNVVMEALAAKKPVVATDVGGVAELVKQGMGYLVPARDPAELATKMTELVNLSSAERQAMGERGYVHVNTTYALEAVILKWEQLFLELMTARGLYEPPDLELLDID